MKADREAIKRKLIEQDDPWGDLSIGNDAMLEILDCKDCEIDVLNGKYIVSPCGKHEPKLASKYPRTLAKPESEP